MKRIRHYTIMHDRYKWWWEGTRWTVCKSIAKLYTKVALPLPLVIQEFTLVKRLPEDLSTWEYVFGDRKLKIVKVG